MPEFEPHTRNEALLNAIRENTGGGTGSVDFEPRTRNEYLLNEIRKNTEGGGGGGGGSGLPNVTEQQNDQILIVNNGAWEVGYANNSVFDSNRNRPISGSAVETEINWIYNFIQDKVVPVFLPCDATAYAVMDTMIPNPHAPITPNAITFDELSAFMALSYLVWSNGTKCESGKALIELDMTNSAITLYARGKSSMVSAVMGVDTSWTVTSL